MTLIRELIDIPLEVRDGDYVLKLVEGVTEAEAQRTVDTYEVTDQLVEAFDRALKLVAGTLETGRSQAAYLHGSFGSGKSHFMAVLHLLLQGHAGARSLPELADVVATHGPRLEGKRFLLVPVHFLDARSVEQKVLDGYLTRVAQLHPEAGLPAVFLADEVLAAELPQLRQKLGEAQFLADLNEASGSAANWGSYGQTWTSETVDAALAAPPTAGERADLVAAYVGAYRKATSAEARTTGEGYVDLDRGLAAISAHAQSLGYDGIVLFLDELVLWLASSIGALDFVQREAQKLTLLVEGTEVAHRPVPIVSFVSRQRDLKDLVGDAIVGAERVSFADNLALQSGRFTDIPLQASNLPVVAKRRLLQPIDNQADRQLRGAVEAALDGREDVGHVLLGSEANLELFRTVYPFSPALVNALIDIAEVLQRERSALKVMLQLLVDQRDALALGDIIPVGDLWDVVAARDEPLSREMQTRFERAKQLYRARLRPMLLEYYELDDTSPADAPAWRAFHADDRLLKTVLLAALVPGAEAFRHLTANRLVALNWGAIVRPPIAGRETQMVVAKLRDWQSRAGELRVGDGENPEVSLQLVDVDTQEVIEQAREVFDRPGARTRALHDLIDSELDERIGHDFAGTFTFQWRGTERSVDVVFGNPRDHETLPDAALRAAGDRPKVVIALPLDQAGYSFDDDASRISEWRDVHHQEPSATLCWVPSPLSRQGASNLGRYVALDELLKGDRFELHTTHLSRNQRAELRPVLESQHQTLRKQLADALLVAYGVRSESSSWIEPIDSPAAHFQTLDSSIVVRPPTHPQLLGALEELCDQLYSARHPGHPRFEAKVTPAALRVAWEEIRRALATEDGRIHLETNRRSALRTVVPPLELGLVGENHLHLSRDWVTRLDRRLIMAREQGQPMTVGDLRAWIDDADTSEGARRGLPPEIADLIILTVAAQSDHSLTLGGLPAELEVGRRGLDPRTVLRPEQLPEPHVWRRATTHAGHVFGAASYGPQPSGSDVAALAGKARDWAGQVAEPVARLVRELEQAYGKCRLDDGERLRTARAGQELVVRLGQADNMGIVSVLAELNVPSTLEAFGRSLSTAAAVADALHETNWRLLDLAFPSLGASVADLLRADEVAMSYLTRMRRLEEDATAWLEDQQASHQPPAPVDATPTGSGTAPAQPPAPAEPGRGRVDAEPGSPASPEPAAGLLDAVEIRSEADIDRIRRRMHAALVEHGWFRIELHLPGEHAGGRGPGSGD